MTEVDVFNAFHINLISLLSDNESQEFSKDEASTDCFQLRLTHKSKVEIYEGVFTIGDCIEFTSNTNVPPFMFIELVGDALHIDNSSLLDSPGAANSSQLDHKDTPKGNDDIKTSGDDHDGTSDNFTIKSQIIDSGQTLEIKIILKKRTKYEKDVSFTLVLTKKKINELELLRLEMDQLKNKLKNNYHLGIGGNGNGNGSNDNNYNINSVNVGSYSQSGSNQEISKLRRMNEELRVQMDAINQQLQNVVAMNNVNGINGGNPGAYILAQQQQGDGALVEAMEPIGMCNKCNTDIFKRDIQLYNGIFDSKQNEWQHINCKLIVTAHTDDKNNGNGDDHWNLLLCDLLNGKNTVEFKDRLTVVTGFKANNNNNNNNNININNECILFGSTVVNGGIKQWSIRISKLSKGVTVCFGITNIANVNRKCKNLILGLEDTFMCKSDGNDDYGVKFGSNDVITVVLDMNHHILSFFKNSIVAGSTLNSSKTLKNKEFILFLKISSPIGKENDFNIQLCHNQNITTIKDNDNKCDDNNDNVGSDDVSTLMKEKIENFKSVVNECRNCSQSVTKYDLFSNNIRCKNGLLVHQNCDDSISGTSGAETFKSIASLSNLTINDMDEWNPILSSHAFKISKNSSNQLCCAQFYPNHNQNCYHTLYGSIVVGPNAYKVWNIKIKNVTSNTMAIGVMNVSNTDAYRIGTAYSTPHSIAYFAGGQIYNRQTSSSTGMRFSSGDIVTVVLDTRKNTVCFFRNSQLCNLIENINNTSNCKSCKWVLMANFYYAQDSVQIVADSDGDGGDKEDNDKNADDTLDVVIEQCAKCNEAVTKRDCLYDNVMVGKTGDLIHKQCGKQYKISKLSVEDDDEWDILRRSPACYVRDDKNRIVQIQGGNGYHHAFGCIKIGKKDMKTWHIRANRLTNAAYMWIGIIENDPELIAASKNSTLHQNAKVICYRGNGYFHNRGTNEQVGIPFATGNVLSMKVDIPNNRMIFIKNGNGIICVKDKLTLQGRQWILYACLYYPNDEIAILDECKENENGYGFEHDERGKVFSRCNQCNKDIFDCDFKYNNVKYVNLTPAHLKCNINIPKLNHTQMDQFHPLRKGYKIDITNNGRIAKRSGDASLWQTCVGCITVSKGKKQWKVKKVNGSGGNVYIGVIDADRCDSHLNLNAYSTGYGFCYGSSYIYKNGSNQQVEQLKPNETITIVLDMDNKIVYFEKNNQPIATVKDFPFTAARYCLFATIYQPQDSVEIVG